MLKIHCLGLEYYLIVYVEGQDPSPVYVFFANPSVASDAMFWGYDWLRTCGVTNESAEYRAQLLKQGLEIAYA